MTERRVEPGAGDEPAPSAVDGRPGAPGVLGDHGGAGFGPDAVAHPAEADDRDAAAEEVPLPAGRGAYLVDPDPVGWGVPGGRRVVPPVLGEDG